MFALGRPQYVSPRPVAGDHEKSGQIGLKKRIEPRRPISSMIVNEEEGAIPSPVLIDKFEKRFRIVGGGSIESGDPWPRRYLPCDARIGHGTPHSRQGKCFR